MVCHRLLLGLKLGPFTDANIFPLLEQWSLWGIDISSRLV
jgi:hypothetical protein